MRPIQLLVVAAIPLAGCHADAATDPAEFAPAADRTSATLPFRGGFEGQLTFVPPFAEGSLDECNARFSGDPLHPGPSVSAFDEGRGNFTFLGRTRIVSHFCFDPDSPVSGGSGTLTGARGTRVDIRFENAASAPDEAGRIRVAGTQWITGGTGRFAGATGRQSCRFVIDATTLRIAGRCEGDVHFARRSP